MFVCLLVRPLRRVAQNQIAKYNGAFTALFWLGVLAFDRYDNWRREQLKKQRQSRKWRQN